MKYGNDMDKIEEGLKLVQGLLNQSSKYFSWLHESVKVNIKVK
jgi:hypothetical protein